MQLPRNVTRTEVIPKFNLKRLRWWLFDPKHKGDHRSGIVLIRRYLLAEMTKSAAAAASRAKMTKAKQQVRVLVHAWRARGGGRCMRNRVR